VNRTTGHRVYRYVKGGPVHGTPAASHPGASGGLMAAKCSCGWESDDVQAILAHEREER